MKDPLLEEKTPVNIQDNLSHLWRNDKYLAFKTTKRKNLKILTI